MVRRVFISEYSYRDLVEREKLSKSKVRGEKFTLIIPCIFLQLIH